VPQVRCIDADGSMVGVVATARARALASQQGLDLVEISPNAKPPVCRIMDFGKYRYNEKRKERDAKKKHHVLTLKEIKFHANVEEHDYQTKLNNIRKFLAKGHKVKVSLYFRGRENAHRDLGFHLIDRVIKDCEDVCGVDMPPKLLGRGILSILTPQSAKSAKGGK
jgi:translation initiation factor IF-3